LDLNDENSSKFTVLNDLLEDSLLFFTYHWISIRILSSLLMNLLSVLVVGILLSRVLLLVHNHHVVERWRLIPVGLLAGNIVLVLLLVCPVSLDWIFKLDVSDVDSVLHHGESRGQAKD